MDNISLQLEQCFTLYIIINIYTIYLKYEKISFKQKKRVNTTQNSKKYIVTFSTG